MLRNRIVAARTVAVLEDVAMMMTLQSRQDLLAAAVMVMLLLLSLFCALVPRMTTRLAEANITRTLLLLCGGQQLVVRVVARVLLVVYPSSWFACADSSISLMSFASGRNAKALLPSVWSMGI